MRLVSATPALRNLWAVTVMGSLLLLDIAITLWRSRALAHSDYFELAVSAVTIVLVWLGYRRQLQDLNKVAKGVDDKALARLSATSFFVVILAYLFAGQALANIHR